jgi:hypothetical protein
MSTRRLHARLAYVMRVDDRASVAYAPASCRPMLRGKKNVDAVGLRIARLAYVMHYSLGTRAPVMRTRRLHARSCARLGKVFGARPNPATITYNAKDSVLAARQHVLKSLVTRCIATRLTKECLPKTCASLVRCICHCTAKLRSRILYGQVK